jgi:hypothetical protein
MKFGGYALTLRPGKWSKKWGTMCKEAGVAEWFKAPHLRCGGQKFARVRIPVPAFPRPIAGLGKEIKDLLATISRE